MENTIKNFFENDSLIITRILHSSELVRIDVKRRFPVADKSSFLSKWCTYKYANLMSLEYYGKPLNELNAY